MDMSGTPSEVDWFSPSYPKCMQKSARIGGLASQIVKLIEIFTFLFALFIIWVYFRKVSFYIKVLPSIFITILTSVSIYFDILIDSTRIRFDLFGFSKNGLYMKKDQKNKSCAWQNLTAVQQLAGTPEYAEHGIYVIYGKRCRLVVSKEDLEKIYLFLRDNNINSPLNKSISEKWQFVEYLNSKGIKV